MEKDLSKWTKPQLQDHLRKLGLKVSGNKPELIKRIRERVSSKSIGDLPTEILTEVLHNLDDKALNNTCKTNKRAAKICKDNTFWKDRLKNRFNIKLRVHKNENISYKDMYNFFKEYSNISTNEQIVNASEFGYSPVWRYIIDNLKYDEQLALNDAVDLDLFKYLVYQGANVFIPDDFGNTVFTNAAMFGILDIVEYIVENLKPDEDALNSALIASTVAHDTSVLEYLIDTIEDPDLDAALVVAAEGSLDAVVVLIEHGADPYANDEEAIATASNTGQEEILEYMQENTLLGI